MAAFVRLFPIAALCVAAAALTPADASACPPGGHRAAVEDDQTVLLQALVRVERSALSEESSARAEKELAKKRRFQAANLREQVRLFPDLDARALLARAGVADQEAASAEARAKGHQSRAKTLRARAAELKRQLGGKVAVPKPRMVRSI